RLITMAGGLGRMGAWLRRPRKMPADQLSAGDGPASVLAPSIFENTERFMAGRTYKLFLGVERNGLVWAGEMARRLNVPCAYFSLELYTNDFPGNDDFRRLKRFESVYHELSRATIVQDVARAKILFEDN